MTAITAIVLILTYFFFRHGLAKTDVNILYDPDLAFREIAAQRMKTFVESFPGGLPSNCKYTTYMFSCIIIGYKFYVLASLNDCKQIFIS